MRGFARRALYLPARPRVFPSLVYLMIGPSRKLPTWTERGGRRAEPGGWGRPQVGDFSFTPRLDAAASRRPRSGRETYACVLTICSHISLYCFWYAGHTFSSATLRKASTLAALTAMPLGSSSSLALARLSTDSVSWRILACASRETSSSSFCSSFESEFQMPRLITFTVGP